jgi:2-polyprenyl-6-methoxyphenol hydroxylase-like FAD-dependent oxidoreductase
MPSALIVGAGIGGLAAGISLRLAGWDVRIFERADVAREIGFGLGLAPNAMTALRALGLAETIVAQSVAPFAGEIRRADGGSLRRFTADRDTRPSALGTPDSASDDRLRLILRKALHSTLLDGLVRQGVVPEVNRGALRFTVDGARVRLNLSDGTSAEGDIVVGADGFGSTIRALLHPTEPPPRPSGYFAVRGLSRAVDRMDGLDALWYFGSGVESGIVRAGVSEIYWFLSLFADDVRSGPLDVESVVRRSTSGFDAQFRAITGATSPAEMRLDELFVREPLDEWGAGAVTLAGDAAHPMLPHTGQGAAQALEDAVELGRALKGTADYAAALRAYEAVRSPRTRRVVRMGPRIARITTTKNPIVAMLRNNVIRLMPSKAIVKAFTQAGEGERKTSHAVS